MNRASTSCFGFAALSGVIIALAAVVSAASAAEEDSLKEVVVTAQFKPENAQAVPISMSIVSAEEMERLQISSLIDIDKAAPNVVLRESQNTGKAMQAFIRYVGQFDYSFTVEPGVGIYVDDQYLATLYGSLLDLLDLEAVEVYRGPQGTLFGRNSIGGAIRLTTRKPQGDGDGSLELIAGSLNRRDIRGTIDLALVPNRIFLRLAAGSKQRDGYVDQLAFGCVHPELAGIANPDAPLLPLLSAQPHGPGCRVGRLGGENVQSARGTLRWLATDHVEADLAFDWMNDHSEALAQTLLMVDPNAATPSSILYGFNGAVAVPLYGIPYDRRFIAPGFYQSYGAFAPLPHVGPSETAPSAVTGITSSPNEASVRSYGVGVTVNWKISTALQFTSITAWRNYSGAFSNDLDDSPINETFQRNVLDHRQFSQELRLTGSGLDARVNWTAGLFYFDSYGLNRGPVDLSALSWFAPSVDFNQHDSTNLRDRAAYLEVAFKLTRQLTLSVGARYTAEDKDYVFEHTSFLPEVPNLIPRTTAAVRYGKTNPRVTLDYHWTPDLLVYASWATGFRAGGFNGRPFNPSQVTSFGPETLVSYELGLKSEWIEHRLRVNVSAFLSHYRDLQVPIFTVDSSGTGFSEPVNVGRAQITGAEIALEYRPTLQLFFSAWVGLSSYENKALGAAVDCAQVSTPVPTPAQGANCTLGGLSLGSVPPFLSKATVGGAISYLEPLPQGSTLRLALNANYQSRSYADTTALSELGGRLLLDGNLMWRSPSARWSVALMATNLTGKRYYLNKVNDIGLWGQLLGEPGPPREWAVSVKRTLH
jgi:iron complex outermembrane recepter protein